MESPFIATTPTVKEQVRQLRQQNRSLREIARRLGITKYRVETIFKELNDDAFRAHFDALFNAGRTHHDQWGRAESATIQPKENQSQTPEGQHQPAVLGSQPLPQSASDTHTDSSILHKEPQNAAKKAVKTAKKAYFPGLSSFMTDYRKLLSEMHRDIIQGRCYWRHYIEGTLLKRLENLQKRGQRLAQEQGLEYEELLLSEVIKACHDYLQHMVRTAPAVRIWMTMRSLQFPSNKALMELLQRAQQAEFDSVEPEQGSAAA